MTALLHPGYFLNIAHFAVMAQYEVLWEVCDNYQKQTYRNRSYICTDRGLFMMNIPIKHIGGAQGKQSYKEVRPDNDYHWQRQHWRTLQTAYRTSPFFEYYEDDIAPLFEDTFDFLLDFNLKTLQVICDCLQIPMPQNKTTQYELVFTGGLDARYFINPKQTLPIQQPEYVQVFGSKHGFIKNVSTLDLLFNEGPTAVHYLQQLDLSFLHA
ncbi:WbqC family protein [Arenibacter sp. GZD96]|uniref:WbqC family protein n=1 Tax=Aurantibrevibacter litoralis TaxID=3106030 RepID=UPI002AFF8A7D|nr:WbqC family protein [Arenibacter sp. GZD-96]MEA1785073.1 WbqC family protein [Arenibacter sp. GZD-96]